MAFGDPTMPSCGIANNSQSASHACPSRKLPSYRKNSTPETLGQTRQLKKALRSSQTSRLYGSLPWFRYSDDGHGSISSMGHSQRILNLT